MITHTTHSASDLNEDGSSRAWRCAGSWGGSLPVTAKWHLGTAQCSGWEGASVQFHNIIMLYHNPLLVAHKINVRAGSYHSCCLELMVIVNYSFRFIDLWPTHTDKVDSASWLIPSISNLTVRGEETQHKTKIKTKTQMKSLCKTIGWLYASVKMHFCPVSYIKHVLFKDALNYIQADTDSCALHNCHTKLFLLLFRLCKSHHKLWTNLPQYHI